MASKKRRQTMDKLQREQTVKRRRLEKQQKKDEAKLAKAMGLVPAEAGLEAGGGEMIEASEGEKTIPTAAVAEPGY